MKLIRPAKPLRIRKSIPLRLFAKRTGRQQKTFGRQEGGYLFLTAMVVRYATNEIVFFTPFCPSRIAGQEKRNHHHQSTGWAVWYRVRIIGNEMKIETIEKKRHDEPVG